MKKILVLVLLMAAFVRASALTSADARIACQHAEDACEKGDYVTAINSVNGLKSKRGKWTSRTLYLYKGEADTT